MITITNIPTPCYQSSSFFISTSFNVFEKFRVSPLQYFAFRLPRQQLVVRNYKEIKIHLSLEHPVPFLLGLSKIILSSAGFIFNQGRTTKAE